MDRHGSRNYMKLSTKVVEARWDEEAGIWNLTLEDQVTRQTRRDWCHVLVNGTGILNNWKWPDIPGLDSFRGELMHSAAWNPTADWRGKTVAVLGCGSSGVQIVPTIQPGRYITLDSFSSTLILVRCQGAHYVYSNAYLDHCWVCPE